MIQKIKKTLLSLTALFMLAAPIAVVAAVPASAQNKPEIQNKLCEGSTLQFGGNQNCQTVGNQSETKVNKLITDIINIFSVIVGIVAVIMIIIGGFRYIVSGGSGEQVGNAKNTILYALIGLVIVAFAQFVVKFILGRITQS